MAFEPPDGFCLLQPETHQSDAIFLEQVRIITAQASEIIAIVADCPLLEEYRSGYRPYLNRYGILSVIKMNGAAVKIPGAARADFLDMMERDMAGLDWPEMRKSVAETYSGYGAPMRPGEIKPLGVIARDDSAFYVGFFANYGTPERPLFWTANVMATTLINEHPISFNLYAEYKGDHTFEWLIQTQQNFMPWLVELNDKGPGDSSRNWIFALITGACIILLLAQKKRG